MLKNTSISKKVIFILVLLVSTIISIIMVFYYFSQKDNMYKKLNMEMSFTSERIANNCAIPVWNYDLTTIESISSYALQNENIISIRIYADKVLAVNLTKNSLGKVVQNKIEPILLKDTVKVEKTILFKNEITGKCEIVYTYSFLKKSLKTLIFKIILITLAFECFFIVIIYFSLKFFVLKPVIELEEQVSRFSSENLILNISTKSNDEIGKLANTFKKMGLELKESFQQKKIQFEEIKRISQELESKNNELNYLNQNLEKLVIERTTILNETINTLQLTQDQLIQSEKMASLGSLVAGVAHEVNTPLGICITASSYLGDEVKNIEKKLETNELSEEYFLEFLEIAASSTKIIEVNLKRAGDLIKSFKQIAVDQTIEIEREFKVKEYLNEILYSLYPNYKKTNHKITIECDEDITLKTFPGAFVQILSNLITNSLFHGFEGIESGTISIKCYTEKGFFVLDYNLSVKSSFD